MLRVGEIGELTNDGDIELTVRGLGGHDCLKGVCSCSLA